MISMNQSRLLPRDNIEPFSADNSISALVCVCVCVWGVVLALIGFRSKQMNNALIHINIILRQFMAALFIVRPGFIIYVFI